MEFEGRGRGRGRGKRSIPDEDGKLDELSKCCLALLMDIEKSATFRSKGSSLASNSSFYTGDTDVDDDDSFLDPPGSTGVFSGGVTDRENLGLGKPFSSKTEKHESTPVLVPLDDIESKNGQFADDEKSDDEDEGPLQPPGFLLPSTISIPSMGDYLREGQTVVCVAGEIYGPSEFFLAVSTTSPDDLNKFIAKMTDSYRHFAKPPDSVECMLNNRSRLIRPGSIVACINPRDDALEQDEVVRAKIIRKVPIKNPEEENPYLVLLLDLGTYETVELSNMFFLHEEFLGQCPAFAFKCRLHLDPYYDDFHEGKSKTWSKETIDFMNDVLKMRHLDVRFVRRVPEKSHSTDEIWEVSIPKIEPDHPAISPGHVVERQIMERTTGEYHDGKEEESKTNQAENNISSESRFRSLASSSAPQHQYYY